MIVWDQKAGTMHDAGGRLIGRGYAGAGLGKNNPEDQGVQGVGPVPVGIWDISTPRNSPNTGPFTLDLTPQPGTNTMGRSSFRIHGDSIADPGHASHGCIILPRIAREAIWNAGDHVLRVVA